MLPTRVEQAPQIYNTVAIEQKCLNCRTPSTSEPDEQHEIVAPREVLVPAVAARMVQRCGPATHRVRRYGLVVLVVIAALACQGQVIQGRGTAPGPRIDVLDREGLGCVLCLAPAVLATSLGALDDALA